MSPGSAVLEIALDRVGADAHQVELRFVNPVSEAEVDPARGDVKLDLAALRQFELNPRDYGTALSSMLFAADAIRSRYRQVKFAVRSMNLNLRVRVRIDPNLPDLHSLRWELLCDPDTGAYLFTSDRVLFSRFMTSDDWRTVELRPKSELTALVAVSAPSNLATYQTPWTWRVRSSARASN